MELTFELWDHEVQDKNVVLFTDRKKIQRRSEELLICDKTVKKSTPQSGTMSVIQLRDDKAIFLLQFWSGHEPTQLTMFVKKNQMYCPKKNQKWDAD